MTKSCYRNILCIPYTDHVSIEYNQLKHLPMKRTLKWYGDVTRSTGIAKDYPARQEKERRTEEELDRQYQRMERTRLLQDSSESKGPSNVELCQKILREAAATTTHCNGIVDTVGKIYGRTYNAISQPGELVPRQSVQLHELMRLDRVCVDKKTASK